jgi:hypothetical protein
MEGADRMRINHLNPDVLSGTSAPAAAPADPPCLEKGLKSLAVHGHARNAETAPSTMA